MAKSLFNYFFNPLEEGEVGVSCILVLCLLLLHDAGLEMFFQPLLYFTWLSKSWAYLQQETLSHLCYVML